MKWIIQELLNNENYLKVRTALEHTNNDFLIVKYENNKLYVISEDYTCYEDNEQIKQFIDNKRCFYYGNKDFITFMDSFITEPYSFDTENFNFSNISAEHLQYFLNADNQIVKFKDIELNSDNFFIRPNENNKLFTGKAITKEEFLEWRNQSELSNNERLLNSLMVISDVKEINSEFRFFIVDSKIATYSSYVVNKRYNISEAPPKDMLTFVENIIKEYPLSTSYVIDIADINSTYKIVEYNNINASAVYNADISLLIQAFNTIKNK